MTKFISLHHFRKKNFWRRLTLNMFMEKRKEKKIFSIDEKSEWTKWILEEFRQICRLESSICRRYFSKLADLSWINEPSSEISWNKFKKNFIEDFLQIIFHFTESLPKSCRRTQSVAARRAQSRRGGGISKNGRKVWSKATALESSQNWVGVMEIFSYKWECAEIMPFLTDFYIIVKLYNKSISSYMTRNYSLRSKH
jgi:hypothetical protein